MLVPGISFLDGGCGGRSCRGSRDLEFWNFPLVSLSEADGGSGTWNLDLGISPSLSQSRTVGAGPGIWILESPPSFSEPDGGGGTWNLDLGIPPPLSQSRTVGAGPGSWILEFPESLSLRAGRWGRDLVRCVRPCPLLLRELALPRLPKPFVFGIRYSVFGIRSIGYSVAQRGCEARSTSALACTAVAICVRPAWQNHSRCAVST